MLIVETDSGDGVGVSSGSGVGLTTKTDSEDGVGVAALLGQGSRQTDPEDGVEDGIGVTTSVPCLEGSV